MRYIFLGLIAIFLIACSPKYVIKTLYTQPTTNQGKVSVQECNVKRETCQINCNQKRDRCLTKAKEGAKNNFSSLMDEYAHIMRGYEAEMNRYDGEIDSWDRKHLRMKQQFKTYRELCDKKKDRNPYECRRARETDNELSSLEAIEPTAPPLPNKPLLSEEIKIAQKSCSNKCGCQKEYDNCFVSYGGTLNYKKFCIENCK